MRVYIQGQSALEHYRSNAVLLDRPLVDAGTTKLEDASAQIADVQSLSLYRAGIEGPDKEHPVHVLVGSPAQRGNSRAVKACVWGADIPRGAFISISDELYISSPEFLFLQMARDLDVPELAALGMELCGTYRRNVRVPMLGTTREQRVTEYFQPTLTTPKKIQSFIKAAKGARGASKALMALRYVQPGSASPMETAVCLLLCLPRRLGGYAIPLPVLNPVFPISKAGRAFTRGRHALPDLYWKEVRLDVEYLGDDFHTDDNRAADSMRRKALERMNIEVIELTKEEVLSVEIFHAVALRIAAKFQRRIRSESEGGFRQRRARLREMILPHGDGSYTHNEPVAGGQAEHEALWEEESFDTDGRIYGARHDDGVTSKMWQEY